MIVYQPVIPESLAADRADTAIEWPYMQKALLTNWQAGNFDEGGSAKTTIRREQGCKQAFCSRAHPRDEGGLNPNNLGPGRPS